MTAQEMVQQAFDRLATRSGFETRQNQVHLSLLLSDLIEQGATAPLFRSAQHPYTLALLNAVPGTEHY